MGNDIDIKELWQKQVIPVADRSGLFKEISSFRKRRVFELMVLNAILWVTICFVIFVWIYFEPQLLITKIGIVLTILSIGVVLAFNYKIIPLYRTVGEERSNLDYLNELLAVKHKENMMQTKLMNFYFISLSLGISLYMYEYVMEGSWLFRIIAYSALFLWIGLNWFIMRPRIISKKRQKIDHLIRQIEKIRLQLDKS